MTKPSRITQERARALLRVATIAGGLVLDTPYDPAKKQRGTAYVGYYVLERLNTALVEAGFAMDKARASYDRVGEAQKARREHIARLQAKKLSTRAG